MANAVEMSTMRKLVAQLNQYRHEYYNLNAPSVADDVYDYAACPQGIDTQTLQGSVAPLVERDSETFSIMLAVHRRLLPAAYDILSDTDPDRPC